LRVQKARTGLLNLNRKRGDTEDSRSAELNKAFKPTMKEGGYTEQNIKITLECAAMWIASSSFYQKG